MLVECPRCHFKQPQDQYCANCGVDMLSFKRKEEPVLGKILQSGLFQFLLVVLLGVGVTYFVIQADKPQQWIQKINRVSSFKANTNPEAKSTEAGIPEDTPSDQANFEAPPPPTWSARGTTPQGGTSAPSEAAETSLSQGEGEVVSETALLQITMSEVDQTYLTNFVTDYGALLSSTGDIQVHKVAAVVPFDNSQWKSLTSTNNKVANDTPNRTMYGQNQRGFDFTFSVNEGDEYNRVFKVTYIKRHPSDNLRFNFDTILYKNDKVIIHGSQLLTYFDQEPDLANTPPFQIFQSADYRSQKTTFAIIIERK